QEDGKWYKYIASKELAGNPLLACQRRTGCSQTSKAVASPASSSQSWPGLPETPKNCWSLPTSSVTTTPTLYPLANPSTHQLLLAASFLRSLRRWPNGSVKKSPRASLPLFPSALNSASP